MFRQISLSLEILLDVPKRNYLHTRLESDRRKKVQYAAANQKRKDMIDVSFHSPCLSSYSNGVLLKSGLGSQALNAREEDAKQARVAQGKRRQQTAEEEAIKDAGKRMLEEAQRRAMAMATATQAKGTSHDNTNGHSNGSHPHATNGQTSATRIGSGSDERPHINPLDLRLILQFPPTSTASSSSSTVQSTLQNRYGPIAHVVVTDPPQPEPGKKKKKKGRKALVEFGPGNWGGCWACWRDHDDEGRAGGRVEEGVRAKWAGGRVPDWVDWAARQSHGHDGQPNGHDPQSASNGNGNGNGHEPSAPTFGSAPDFGGTIMADLVAQHARQKESKIEARKKENEYESMTLLRMRQMERDRLAEQIRREEEEEGMA